MTDNIKEKFSSLINEFEKLEMYGYLDMKFLLKQSDNWKEFIKKCGEEINKQEIVNYSNAMEYLNENDPSLTESLNIINDINGDFSNVNNEYLATLLLQQRLHNELKEMGKNVFEKLFENS